MGERYGGSIEEDLIMPDKPEYVFQHADFWARMERNSEIVASMPVWMKGSPVNRWFPPEPPEPAAEPASDAAKDRE